MVYHFQLTPRLLVIGTCSLLALLLLLFLTGLEIGRQMASPAPLGAAPGRGSSAHSAASKTSTLPSQVPGQLPTQLPTQLPAQVAVQQLPAPEATAVTQTAPNPR